jgi:hypothetical protein
MAVRHGSDSTEKFGTKVFDMFNLKLKRTILGLNGFITAEVCRFSRNWKATINQVLDS